MCPLGSCCNNSSVTTITMRGWYCQAAVVKTSMTLHPDTKLLSNQPINSCTGECYGRVRNLQNKSNCIHHEEEKHLDCIKLILDTEL